MAGADQRKAPYPVDQVQDHSGFVWSDETLRLVFKNSPDAILLIEEGKCVDCNQAAVEMFGFAGRNELLSLSPRELSPGVQPDGVSSITKADEMISIALAKGSHRFEWTAKRADDSEFPTEVLLTSIPSDHRQVLHAVWRDISRRKAAEVELSKSREALQNQTEVLQSILHHMGDAVIVADKDYKFLTFNPAAERMFGTSASETQSEGWSRTYGLYLSDQQTPFPQDQLPLARSISGENVDDLEMFARHEKTSEGVWIRVSGRPLRDSSGELAGGVIVCRDITERKREDAFRAGQSAVLEMIARGAALENVLENLVKLIEAQSEGMLCSVVQLSEDGKYIRHGAAPSLPDVYVQAVNGAPIGPKNGSCGTAMFRGEPVIVIDMLTDPLWEDYVELARLSGLRACWSTPIFSGKGKVIGSFAMYYRQPQVPTGTESRLTEVATHIAGIAIEHQEDITARRRAEDEVRLLQAISMEVAVAPDLSSALEVVLRRVCQSTGWILGQSWIPRTDGAALECGPTWFSSAEGLEDFRLGSLNARMPPGVGLPGRVWLSKQPLWIRDVSVDSNFPRAVLARESGLKAALALPIIAGENVIAVIEFFMRETQSEDERLVKVISAVVAQLDLAIERKRAEEQLRDTQVELAHVARVTTMGELAASIAHEVNQPLGAIVGNAEICLSWLDNDSPDLTQLREAIDDIVSDGHRASQVISRIRSLVKKHLPEKTILDLSDVAREVLDLVSHDAQRKQVTLVPEFSKQLPLVAADRVQLQQVLLNLVMNGIEAMRDIDGRKPCLTLTTQRLNDGAQAIVSDSGVGFDSASAEQLFKPFHTTKSGGMGMGLAISRSIIEAHGGKLWAEPNREFGASFKFTLPAAPKDEI